MMKRKPHATGSQGEKKIDTFEGSVTGELQVLARFFESAPDSAIRISTDNDSIDISAETLKLLVRASMHYQTTLTAAAGGEELTTTQAAEMLHVSRPYLINLLEDGQIPYRRVGTHRRIRIDDVQRYKQAIDQAREAILDQLVVDAQENDMGYSIDR